MDFGSHGFGSRAGIWVRGVLSSLGIGILGLLGALVFSTWSKAFGIFVMLVGLSIIQCLDTCPRRLWVGLGALEIDLKML